MSRAPAAVTQRRTIRKLTGVSLPVTEAARAWDRIIDHKWYVSERMGRDVGLRVAAIDYFENVAPPAQPVRRISNGGLPAPLPMMRSLTN